ncbi:ATP-dependent 6-phosphofructokinase [Conexibacter sp. DBS9H8]|uniref:ATP-dependent 6-phosphofructokinase n=1 Tax=Conexibacter sp. DBS9H8 TaxID=2937801 RepID=UPI00200FBDF8|nr:ATP-dependent 6-phosphofructokinase [Conexibacter sp. DBS9H8]
MFTFNPADLTAEQLAIRTLGEARHRSPLSTAHVRRPSSLHWVDTEDRVLFDDSQMMAGARGATVSELPSLEPGGPRSHLFFNPAETNVAIVTCGGLCPGINDVIRGLVIALTEQYGVRSVLGFRNGFRGLVPPDCENPIPLSADGVRGIDRRGGSLLGTSRGAQDPGAIVDTLGTEEIDVLFVVGGDGSLRGASAIAAVARERGLDIAVVGVPKTIDNDIPFIDYSFGFQTAFSHAAEAIRAAHVEAESHHNGVGVVKLMGRHSGFIACYAALACHEADVVLIPEVPVGLEGPNGLLEYVHRRVDHQGHCVVVVAEGAGQDLLPRGQGTDASGNARLADVGALIRERLIASFAAYRRELNLRYVDPGYAIRSVPAAGYDAVYCTRLAHAAVHAALSGRTDMIVAGWHGRFVHLPIGLVTSGRNVVDPGGDLWLAVIETTGQPPVFRAAVNLNF